MSLPVKVIKIVDDKQSQEFQFHCLIEELQRVGIVPKVVSWESSIPEITSLSALVEIQDLLRAFSGRSCSMWNNNNETFVIVKVENSFIYSKITKPTTTGHLSSEMIEGLHDV